MTTGLRLDLRVSWSCSPWSCSLLYGGLVVFCILLAHSLTTADAQSPTQSISQTLRLSFNATNYLNSLVRGTNASNNYVILPNDVVWLKVYQEDDLETKAKVGRDGLVTVPLLGPVTLAGKTVDEATSLIRDLLDKRFIVNPQVSLTVTEYSKRKFTILGQVARPGVYEYPGDEKLTALQAIALAGGFTRLASPSKVTIQRIEHGQPKSYKIHAEAVMKDPSAGPFQVQPDDTITVGSRVF